MKWLKLLNDSSTRKLYLLGGIVSVLYAVLTTYFYLTKGVTRPGTLALAAGLLAWGFVISDTTRFVNFFSSRKIRLLPLKTVQLYGLNLLLSLINAVLFTLINGAICSVAHVIIYQSLNVPDFEFAAIGSVWNALGILGFYILLQFFSLAAQAIWQRWSFRFSRAWIPLVLIILLLVFLYAHDLLQGVLIRIPFALYLAVLVTAAILASLRLIDRHIEEIE